MKPPSTNRHTPTPEPSDGTYKKDERAASSQIALSQNLVRLMRISELSEH
jgi:hypothetical protein